jgi:hypothetical protein
MQTVSGQSLTTFGGGRDKGKGGEGMKIGTIELTTTKEEIIEIKEQFKLRADMDIDHPDMQALLRSIQSVGVYAVMPKDYLYMMMAGVIIGAELYRRRQAEDYAGEDYAGKS